MFLLLYAVVFVLYFIYDRIMYSWSSVGGSFFVSLVMGLLLSFGVWIGYHAFIEMTQGKEKES